MQQRTVTWTLAFSLYAMPSLLFGQQPKSDHDHAHGHHAAESALTLDQGKKWETDAALREGMGKISRIAAEASAKSTAEGRQRAAAQINDEIQKIIKTCKLSPKADANLHLILAEIMNGMGALKDPKVPATEAFGRIQKGLDLYGQYFNHPGWKSH